jgi:hypothetical protein
MTIKFFTMGLTELAAKAGRSTEKATFTRLQKRYPGSNRSLIRSYKIAKIKGERKVQALSKRLDIANPRSIQIQHKKGKEWTFSRPLIEKGSLGGKKLRRFESYVNKRPKNFSQKPMKKNFLQDDDPTRGLKSMRIDKEASYMKSQPSEGRSIGKSLDPVNIDYNKYKKSQLVKMARGEVAEGQTPFTNSQKIKVMAAGQKGLRTFIDTELPSGSTKLYGIKHIVKTGKTYSKRFGQFRLPSNTGKSPSTIIPEFTEKTKIIGSKTKKVTATGTYKWRKGRKNKIYVIE